MKFVFCLLALLLHSARCDWDLGVLTSSTLELLGQGNFESPVSSHHLGVKDITAVTYDPLLLHHYFAASGYKNASIFRAQTSRDGRMGPVEPLVKKQPGMIQGLAFDAESTSVFWTSGSKIYRSQLGIGLSDAEVVHSFDEATDLPVAIVVEPCTRYIYWSYHHGAIDRSLMDGSKKERVINKLYFPLALYISQAERMIYWVDIGPGVGYSIGRALLDGSNKEKVLVDLNQQPTSLVVRSTGPHDSVIYWTDRVTMKLWSFSKNNSNPVEVHTFDQPQAVTTADSFDHLDKHVCLNVIAMRDEVPYSVVNPTAANCIHGTYSSRSNSCICKPGYNGNFCETSICFNYCLTGKCSMSSGKPHCRCPPGITGLRCEMDRCRNYCFHGGCNVEENDELFCSCNLGWYGPRCNYSEQYCAYACQAGIKEQDFCSCNTTLGAAALTASSDSKIDYKLGFIISVGTCGVMFLCLLGLVVKTWKLGKRPRVKRFYKVTPNKGSAPQAVRTSPDCQIAIENCCNMNICDTPCYEPELRPSGGKSKKEEKRGLLKEMEVQPDLAKTF